ncbi:sodium-coupled monocarboxylate transporter 1-like isoform X2 [Panulirus ornatus]|uniref:sodium-coupled monocarboxylate transporter 1-like isoform X2 n=1 Tax=Panulirus ornatus TaxID=150431 RepID=UPI003A8B8C68
MAAFAVADYVVFITSLAISLGIGNSSEMYYYGSQFWMYTLGIVFGSLLTTLVIMPIIYPLRLVSIYEYLEIRWNTTVVRKLSSALQVVNTFIFLGIALYAPSLAISSVTPISTNTSIIALGLVCSVYSSLGGAKAVVYTDSFQTLVMFAGVIAVIIQGCIEAGGAANSWNIDKEHDRIEFFNMDPNPLERHTFMTTVILGIFFSVTVFGTSQAQYQRWGSVATLKESYIVMVMNAIGVIILLSLINYAGLVVFSVYVDCDPLMAGYIEKADQILVYFVVDKLGYLPGIPGLFVAAVYSGVLRSGGGEDMSSVEMKCSTHRLFSSLGYTAFLSHLWSKHIQAGSAILSSSISSSLNAIASNIWEDLLQYFKIFSSVSEAQAKNITIIISMVSGLVSIFLGILAGSMGGLVQVSYSISGAFSGPIAGIFLTAMLCPWVSATSAALGGLSALTLSLWMVAGSFLYAPPPKMLSLSTAGCSEANLTTCAPPYTTLLPPSTTTTDNLDPNVPEVFPLYQISYCLFGAIGVITSLVMANVFSCIVGFPHPSEVPEIAVNKTSFSFYCWLRKHDKHKSTKERFSVTKNTKENENPSGCGQGNLKNSEHCHVQSSVSVSGPHKGKLRGHDNPVPIHDE